MNNEVIITFCVTMQFIMAMLGLIVLPPVTHEEKWGSPTNAMRLVLIGFSVTLFVVPMLAVAKMLGI